MYRFAKTKFWIYTALIMRKILIWGGVIAGLVAVLLVVAYLGSRSQEVKALTLSVPVSDADWKTGPASASATIVEYSDFQCPACAAFYPVVEQVLKDYGDKMIFVYRHFPLRSIHKNSDLAARASEAAGKQGKFWEMHNMLFEKQEEWAEKSNSDAQALFVGYAKTLGLDEKAFVQYIDSDAARKSVNDSLIGGEQAGINSTPTFFLNGRQMLYTSIDGFIKQITDATSAK